MINVCLETARSRRIRELMEGARVYLPGYETVALYAVYMPRTGRWLVVEPDYGLVVGTPQRDRAQGWLTIDEAERDARLCLERNGVRPEEFVEAAEEAAFNLGLVG